MTFKFLSTIILLLPLCAFGIDNKSIPNTYTSLFVENRGQVTDQFGKSRSDIDFKINAPGINIFIGEGQLHYQWCKQKSPAIMSFSPIDKEGKSAQKTEVDIYRLDVVLVGADIHSSLVTEERQDYQESYYLSQCPQGVTASSFRKVIYKNIYPNIDWVLYTDPHREQSILKYDFVVHPGGNPADIQMRYEGASPVKSEAGTITATTPYGTVTEQKPYSYFMDSKAEIPSAFVLNDNTLSFDIEKQDKTIVIDPYLNWGSYFGSSGVDYGLAVAVDKVGDLYVGGMTTGLNDLATFGAHQYTYGGWTQDGFLAKFRRNGTRAWATYYGGNLYEQVNDITTDADGYVYIIGITGSNNGTTIATTGSHQPTHGGSTAGYTGFDAFLVKFNSNGQRLWGTYYGDSLEDIGHSVRCDRDGFVYMAGRTDSRRYIATNGAFKTTYSGGFLVKFSAGGVRQWGTYYGDTGHAYISSIACDRKGFIYCVGSTDAYTNISTPGSHQPANGGGTAAVLNFEDGFLAKFTNGGQRVWSTYYGGEDYDNVVAVACDDRGGVYIGGETMSLLNNSIITSGSAQTTFVPSVICPYTPPAPPPPPSPTPEGFVAKFNEDGVRQWGIYYGTNLRDIINFICPLPNGNIYTSGYRYSPCGGAAASYIVKFNSAGIKKWVQDGISIRTEASIAYNDGKLGFVSTGLSPVIYASPVSLLDTTRGFFKSVNGPCDAYIQHYDVDTSAFFPLPFGDTSLCLGDTLHIPYDVTNKFNPGNVLKVQLSDLSGSFANATTIVTTNADTGGLLKYVIPSNLAVGKGYRLRLISSSPADTSLDNYVDIRVSDYPKSGPVAIFPICANGDLQLLDTITNNPPDTRYLWTGPGGFSIDQKQYIRPNVQITDSGYYVLTADNYGCIRKDSVHVIVYAKPGKPVFTNNGPLCVGDTLKLKAKTSGISVYNMAFYQGSNPAPVWYRQDASGDTVINVSSLSDTGRYVTVALAGGCPSDAETTKVVINPIVSPTVSIAATPAGPWAPISFSITGSSNTGSNPAYQWMKNGVDIAGATGTTYSTTTSSDLQTGDTICLRLVSNAVCAVPTTTKSCVRVEIDLGVVNPGPEVSLVRIYPNPNDGNFTIETASAGTLSIENIQGQTVGRYDVAGGKTSISLAPYLSSGVYLGKFSSNGIVTSVQRIVLNR